MMWSYLVMIGSRALLIRKPIRINVAALRELGRSFTYIEANKEVRSTELVPPNSGRRPESMIHHGQCPIQMMEAQPDHRHQTMEEGDKFYERSMIRAMGKKALFYLDDDNKKPKNSGKSKEKEESGSDEDFLEPAKKLKKRSKQVKNKVRFEEWKHSDGGNEGAVHQSLRNNGQALPCQSGPQVCMDTDE